MTKNNDKEIADILAQFAIGGFKIDAANIARERIDKLIQQAIAEHEQSKWKKYPEEKPDKSGWYWVHHKDGYESRVHSEENWELFVESKKVIAFRELPKPYQEERQSFGSLNGCHNCKHQDNDDVCKKCDDTWDKWEGGER